LWLTRALVIAIVRWAARRGVILCPNYFVTESALALPEHTLYTARELAQMTPLTGTDIYQQMRQLNDWSYHFLPNAVGPPPAAPATVLPSHTLQALAERPLRGMLAVRELGTHPQNQEAGARAKW
jgi:hypothetical protein